MTGVVNAGGDPMHPDECIFLSKEDFIISNLKSEVCTRGCALNAFIVQQSEGCCCLFD